ncbi:MAG: Protein fam32a, variant 4 [Marteilia pararefringens]
MKKVRQQEKPVISQNVPNVTQKQDATPKTMAELNFEKIQRDREQGKISKEAKVSYREKINKMNKKLDNLSEFHDILKVGWTK